jgi:multiple antibiotic resistance protein
MDMSLISVSVILFLIMDSIGNVSSFLTLVKDIDAKRVRWIIVREMLIALGFMFLFYILGEVILDLLQVSTETVELASAIILFLTAIKILFPTTNSLRANLPSGEPFIIPLAVPLIAGPSLLATIMLFAHLSTSIFSMLGSILIAWAASVAILWFAKPLQRYLGNNGLMACERLTGMLLVMLAIQRFTEGYHHFLSAHP